MSTLRRPEIVQDFDPGEVPIGTILWFVGNEDRYKQIIDSGKWIGCDGQQIIIDPSRDYDLFEALGGVFLHDYLQMTAEERESDEGKALLDKVSPLLSYADNFTVLDGVANFTVVNKRIENDERKTLTIVDDQDNEISSYFVQASSFKNIGNNTLTGSNYNWSTRGYNGNFEWKDGIDITWPLFVFNAYLGLTFVAGPLEEWYEGSTMKGSYVNDIPSNVSGTDISVLIFPHNISKGEYGREFIDYQQVMESADFSDRKGPYYVTDTFIESGDFEYGVTNEIIAEGFSIQDVNGTYVYDGSDYVKTLDSSLSYKITSDGCCIKKIETINGNDYITDAYEGGNDYNISCLEKSWYRVTNQSDHEGIGNSDGAIKSSDVLEQNARLKMKKRYLYLKDFIEECNKPENASISAQMFRDNYQKWFTSQDIMVPTGESPEIVSFFNNLIEHYSVLYTPGNISWNGTLRATTTIKNETLNMLHFIYDNLIISNNGTQYVFSVPMINEGESIVATKERKKIGVHTDGGLPNLKGEFTGAGRPNNPGFEDGKLFKKGNVSSFIYASGGNGITIYGTSMTFDASRKSSIYSDDNTGVLPAGCFAKAIMRIK